MHFGPNFMNEWLGTQVLEIGNNALGNSPFKNSYVILINKLESSNAAEKSILFIRKKKITVIIKL